ncbi:MAG: AsmA family protein [Bacteroidales bacterium]|nr:AsmA family protein [Bacteroidales bacterium]
MKKILKVLAIIVLVLIVGLFSIPFLFKGKIVDMAKTEINNSVNANVNFGEFDLSIFSSFPNLAFTINDLSVIGTDTFAGDTLAYINKMSLVVDLMSVMGDNIKVRAIELNQPVIHAIALKDGTANWDIAPEDTTAAVTEETPEDTAASNFNLALKRLQITDAIISYRDDDLGVSTTLKHMDLTLKGDMSLAKTTLEIVSAIKEAGFSYEGVDYLTKANITMDVKIGADMDNWVYTFEDNKFIINDLPLSFDGEVAMPTDDISMDLSFGIKDSPFKQLLSLIPALYMNDFSGLKASGTFSFDGKLKGIYNDSLMPGYDINLAINNGSFQYPDLPKAVNNVAMDLNIKNLDSADINKTVVNLKKFHLEMAGNPVDAKLISKNLLVDPYIDAFVKGKVDLGSVKDIMPLDSMELNGIITADLSMKGNMSALEEERYEDFQADGNLGIQNMVYKSADMPGTTINDMLLAFSPQFVALKNFDAKVGKSDLHADGRIDNLLQYYFNDDTLTGKFNFNAGYFDINEWMTDDETATAETTASDTAVSGEELSVVEVPKNINFTLNSGIGKLHYDDLDITDFKGILIVRGGEVIMRELSMQALDGTIAMSGKYSTKDISKPGMDYEMNLTDIDLPKTYAAFNTIQKLAPILEKSTGKISGKMTLSMLLKQNMEPDMKTLNGFGNIQTKNLVIKGSKLFSLMDSFFGTKKFSEFKPKDTNLSIKIKDGNVSFDPFDFAVGKSTAHTEGKQSVEGALDYKMNWSVPKSEFGSQIGSVMDAVSSKLKSQGINADIGDNIDFNVLVGGTIDKADIKVVLGDQTGSVVDAVKDQIKEKVNEEIDKAKQKAIDEAKKKAAQLLAEAQKRADQVKKAAHQTAEKVRNEGKNAAAKIRSEAQKQADDLIKKAGSNPLKKKLAKESAKKIKAEAEKKAKQTENTANKKANDIENKAKQEADGIVNTAKQKGNELIRKAENS